MRWIKSLLHYLNFLLFCYLFLPFQKMEISTFPLLLKCKGWSGELFCSPGCGAEGWIARSALAWCVEYISTSTSKGVPPAEQRWNAQAGTRGAPLKKGGCSCWADERKIPSPLQPGEWCEVVYCFPGTFCLTVKAAVKNPKQPHSGTNKNIGEIISHSCEAHGSPKSRTFISVLLVQFCIPWALWIKSPVSAHCNRAPPHPAVLPAQTSEFPSTDSPFWTLGGFYCVLSHQLPAVLFHSFVNGYGHNEKYIP